MMSRSTGPDAVFQALSDPTRREVMRRLSQDGPTTLGELARACRSRARPSRSTCWSWRRPAWCTCRTTPVGARVPSHPRPLTDAMGWMVDVGAEWDERLDSLRRHVERET